MQAPAWYISLCLQEGREHRWFYLLTGSSAGPCSHSNGYRCSLHIERDLLLICTWGKENTSCSILLQQESFMLLCLTMLAAPRYYGALQAVPAFKSSLEILKPRGCYSSHISTLSSGKSLRISSQRFHYYIFYADLFMAASYNTVQTRFCSRSYVDRTHCGNNPSSAYTDFALLWVPPDHSQFPLHFQDFSTMFQIPATGRSTSWGWTGT